jgi:hypothetical protein
MSTLAELQKSYDRPVVKDYLASREQEAKRKKRTSGYGMPLAAAGLAGAGMGAYWLGDKAMTPEDRLKLDNLSSMASKMDPDSLRHTSAQMGKDYQGSSQLFYDYVDRASEAATAKIYGKPVQTIIEGLRKSPLFRGSAFDISKADPYELKQTDDHYKDFTAGPLAAYKHQLDKLDESFGGSWAATQNYIDPDTNDSKPALDKIEATKALSSVPFLGQMKNVWIDQQKKDRATADSFTRAKMPDLLTGSDDDVGRVFNQLEKREGGPLDTYHEFRQGLDKNFNTFLQEEGAVPQGENNPNIRGIATGMPHGKQMDLLRKFRGWVGVKDPAFAKVLGKVEPKMAEGMAGPARFYAFGGNLGAKLVQDLPRALGAAMVAGGVGLGGYYAYSKIREKVLADRLKKKQLAAKKVLKAAGALPIAAVDPLTIVLYKIATPRRLL